MYSLLQFFAIHCLVLDRPNFILFSGQSVLLCLQVVCVVQYSEHVNVL